MIGITESEAISSFVISFPIRLFFFPGVEQRIGKGVCSMVGLNSLTYPSEVTLFRVKNESSFSLERPLSLWKSVFNLKDPFHSESQSLT